MSYTPFRPNSPRAIAGLGFQQRVFDLLSAAYPEVVFEMTWDYFLNQNSELTCKELAILEKEWGDITYELNGKRYWIECCFAMGNKLSRLCEMKRISFKGKTKWYCYGFAESEEMIFIPSTVWQVYTSRIEKSDSSCRMVPLNSIRNLKAGEKGIENYWNRIHNTTREEE